MTGMIAVIDLTTGTESTRQAGTRTLDVLTRDGGPVASRRETIKGIEYVIFTALPGLYAATYPSDITAPVISSVAVTPTSSSAVITWSTNEPATTQVSYGLSPSLGSSVSDPALQIQHSVTLNGLSPNTTYNYRLSATDAAGNTGTSPAGMATFTFTTPSLVMKMLAGFRSRWMTPLA